MGQKSGVNVRSGGKMFGLHLTEKGLLSPEQLVDALNTQRDETDAIGRIALYGRFLTVKDVSKILNVQATEPGRFGEVGVRLGLLTNSDVRKLLDLQRRSRPPLGEILVRNGILSKEKMLEELRIYHSSL